MTYNIIEPGFQRNNTSAYQLSILVGMDSLVYSVYEPSSNKMLALKSCPFPASGNGHSDRGKEIGEVLRKEDLLGPRYQKVKIALDSSSAALVPQRLFNEDEKATYLEELLDSGKEADIRSDEIASLKIKAVYQVGKPEMAALKKHFPKGSIFNSSTAFLVGCKQAVERIEGKVAFAGFSKTHFQLAVFNKKELQFFNTFSFQSPNDVMYFVLLAFEQHGLDPNSDPLLLSGQIVEKSDIYKMLYRYIADISFCPAPAHVQFGKNAASLNPGFFANLHYLLLCD